MIKRLFLTIGIILASYTLVFSQSGALQGRVFDKQTGEPIPFANVALESGGSLVGGAASDFDGKYTIKPITPGTYSIRVSYIGYQTFLLNGFIVGANKTEQYDIGLSPTAEMLDVVEVVDYKVPVFEKDQTTTGSVVTSDEISKMPNRSAEGVVTSVSGVFSRDGEIGSIRGTRGEASATYIDGIRVIGSTSLPPSAYEQVAVVLAGVPAEYGDVTGGIINITTRGPSRQFGAGIELETSQFLDPFKYNSVGLSINGPLWKHTNKETKTTRSIMGFFLTGNLSYQKDGSPSAIGYHRVDDETLAYLKANPLRPLKSNAFGTNPNAAFVTSDNIKHHKNSLCTEDFSVGAQGKIDIQPHENVNISVGGTYYYTKYRSNQWLNTLMNWEKNSLAKYHNYRFYGRLTQKFPTSPESKSLFKNFYYTIQGDYEQTYSESMDPDHKNNIFQYGYLGKFDVYTRPSYTLGVDTALGSGQVYIQDGFYDYRVSFSPYEANSTLANYTQYFYDLYGENYFPNLDAIQLAGGLLNGQMPSLIYGMWYAPGTITSGYGYSKSSKWSINAKGSMDIGSHNIMFGFMYEQRKFSYWQVSARSLWSLMDQSANFHISQLDFSSPIYNRPGEEQYLSDTVSYKRKYDGAVQRVFDYNLRKALGLNTAGTDFIQIHSYDMDKGTISYIDENNVRHTKTMDESFDLSWFSPDELFNDGSSYVGYYGYDYTGKKQTSKPTLSDFFTETVKVNGKDVLKREIAPYQPIYFAGYIQDKFAFNDIIFNVGLRVDGFDANQSVLKDPYLLYPARTAEYLRSHGIEGADNIVVPSNIGNDFIVYVDNYSNPTKVTGYRNGSTWYNDQGIEISDPEALNVGSGVNPLLESSDLKLNTKNGVQNLLNAFGNYKTQVHVMPRISFSFPISDEAVFLAHYDILTRRPSDIRLNPLNYLFFQQMGQSFINNPNLKPTQTIDYSLGFKQKVTASSAVSIEAYYKEIRDEIQAYYFAGAFPNSYYSYNNIDFATTKGLSISYDLRRTNNVSLRAGYSLQFASGTGSNTEFQKGLIAAGLPNLRTVLPMDYDRRHSINVSVDYRFSSGKEYNGPVIKREKKNKPPVQILSNLGLAVTFNGGSGTPYTRQSNITSAITGGTKLLSGSINGSRLPWEFRIDAKLDKDFYFVMGKNKAGETREGCINVYLACNNLLNTKNAIAVYSATGIPNDDGYLAAAEWQRQISEQLSPQAYRYMYSIYINQPGRYSSPRSLHLGVIFNF